MAKMKYTFKEKLLNKIENKTAIMGVIGLGYIGLPLAVEMAKAGSKTIGFEVQQKKVKWINEGYTYINDIEKLDFKKVIKEGLLKATNDYSFLKDVDIVCVCVPTPLDIYQQPDLSFIKNSMGNIAKYLHAGMLVILESTTYPGTTEELVKPILEEKSNLKCGEDFFLAFSPRTINSLKSGTIKVYYDYIIITDDRYLNTHSRSDVLVMCSNRTVHQASGVSGCRCRLIPYHQENVH